jgi:uncharacterized protein YbbC (DUF1343 family)
MKKISGLFLLILTANLTFGQIKTGAEQMNKYLPLLESKKVGFVGNHTSIVKESHLVDSLLSRGIEIVRIFSPEHGFKGNVSDGKHISNSTYGKQKIPIISIYGKNKKPSKESLSNVDMVLFDMQDVGVRCYTYISTMTYVMEACAENDIPLIVLDRPNPNIHLLDGPVLKEEFKSFVGMHPVPLVYGMTIGEYALMVNEEGWLKNKVKCNLIVIELAEETGGKYTVKNACHFNVFIGHYRLPVTPSPNLPNNTAILLYPHLCLFEGTDVSVGRGTDKAFQSIGKPGYPIGDYYFTPKSIPGVSVNPPHLGQNCRGKDLSKIRFQCGNHALLLSFLLDFYAHSDNKSSFFNSYFNKLAGTDELKKQIVAGWSEEQIRKSWQKDLEQFKKLRSKYLLYERP